MVLLVALDYKAPLADMGQEMGEGREENAFRYFISKLVSRAGYRCQSSQADAQHRKEDFAFVLNGITGILQEHLAVQNGYLPGSKRPVPYILETCTYLCLDETFLTDGVVSGTQYSSPVMLLWRIVDLNKVSRLSPQ